MSFSEAPPPFDRASNVASVDNMRPVADLIVRSCDGVEFYVHKSVLSIASQAFASMFHDASMIVSTEEPLVLQEDARTLDALFRTCYPVSDPTLDKAEEAFKVMEASRKYMMEYAKEVSLKALTSSKHLEEDPFSVFAVACHFNLPEIARKAARFTLFRDPPTHAPVGLQFTSGANIWNLLAYWRECKDVALRLVDDDDFWSSTLDSPWITSFFCATCNPEADKLGFQEEYSEPFGVDGAIYRRVSSEWLRTLPCGVPEEKTYHQLRALILLQVKPTELKCIKCCESMACTIGFFVRGLFDGIERAISKVELKLDFDQ
ncbi:hypothetical protein OBBRIDRAFT_792207 [Obba rivulosa]|uniref:BTB domain-containing protein n=1 Tax=Obba rivulosa TaxID=1052685 RepID=A0A8E2AW80_9APHY|nr:hypothetical protein OBBRIDRAFT_792207 [Obba rivulosa]